MFRPNHRSYYLYFEKQHRKGLLKYSDKKLRVYIAVRKLLGKECSVRGFHFLFNKIKEFLGSGLNTPHEAKLDSYLRFLDHSHPGIFDNFHADLRNPTTFEKEIHPWKLKYRINAHKQKSKIKGRLAHIWKARTDIPNTALN